METSYNTTLPDTSPLFSYFPYAEGDPTEGWDLLYLSSGFAAYEGEAGWGGSAHATRGGAAEVDLTFFGTDIHLYGISLGAATWHTILDSILTPGSPSDSSLLASYTGLEEGTHTLALVVNASAAGAGFAFQGVVVGSGTGLQGATVSNHTVPTTDPSVLLAGQWTAQNSTTVNGTTPGAGTNSSTADAMVLQETPPMGPVMQTTRLGDSAMLTFNGTSITVLGELSPSSGQYYITLNSTSTLQTYTLSAQSQWTVNGAVLFWQAGLETQGETSVWVTNAQEGKALGVGGFVVGQAEGGVAVGATAAGSSATSSRLPTGTIVAIALSITLLIALLFLLLLRHRRRLAGLRPRSSHASRPSAAKRFPFPMPFPMPMPMPAFLSPRPSAPHRSPISLTGTPPSPSPRSRSRSRKSSRATKLALSVTGRTGTFDPQDRLPVSSRDGVQWSMNPSAYSSQTSLLEKTPEFVASAGLAFSGPGLAEAEQALLALPRAPPAASAPAPSPSPSPKSKAPPLPHASRPAPAPPNPPVPALGLAVPTPTVTVRDVARTGKPPRLSSLPPLTLGSPLFGNPASASASGISGRSASAGLPGPGRSRPPLMPLQTRKTAVPLPAPMSTPTPPGSARPMGPRARGSTADSARASASPPGSAGAQQAFLRSGTQQRQEEERKEQDDDRILHPSLLLPPPQRSDTLLTTQTHFRTLSDAVSSAYPTSPASSVSSGGPGPSGRYLRERLERNASFGSFAAWAGFRGAAGAGEEVGRDGNGNGKGTGKGKDKGKERESLGLRPGETPARPSTQGRVRLLPDVPEA